MPIQIVSDADQKLIDKWDQNIKSCQSDRLKFERYWHQNLSYYFGKQWVVLAKSINGSFALTEPPPSDAYRVRYTANKILRIIRTELTKLTKEEPQFFCMPRSMDESDRLAAMAGDAISEYIIRTKYFNTKRTLATFWALMCGTGYLKNYYNPALPDLDGQPGRIDFDAVTAFHLFVRNLQEPDLQRQPFVIHAMTMMPEDVYNQFGIELEPKTDSVSLVTDQRFLASVGLGSSKQSQNKGCYIKEVFIKKNKDFPNGASFIYGEGKLLSVSEAQDEEMDLESLLGGASAMPGMEELLGDVGGPPPSPSIPPPMAPPMGESGPSPTVDEKEATESPYTIRSESMGTGYDHAYPYLHGRFPFVKIDHIPTGMFYGESIIKSLIEPQKEYNRTRSIMMENRNLAGKPQWYYSMGAFNPNKFNSKPGLLLAVTTGFDPPRPLEQPMLPPSVTQETQLIPLEMDDISAQFEVAKGRVPPGVEAASAIAYLSEENDTILHHTVQSIEDAVQETGVQILSNVYEFWPEERIVRMTSKNASMQVRQFKKSDLQPVMDFRVEAGSMAPRSIAAKQAFITELLKMGVLTPQQAFRYMQMSETNKLYDELMIDERHAQRENVYMSEGTKLVKKLPQPDPMEMQSMDPMAMLEMMQQPQVRTDTMKDPMTGEELTDEMGQPVQYEVTTNPFDAHEIHVKEHENFQKTQEFELLPPEIQQLIQDHVDEHKNAMLQERNAIVADQTIKEGIGAGSPEDAEMNPRELEQENVNGGQFTGV